MINVFSLLAVFIAILGLFGQSTLAAESRIKEIGILKVIGAKTSEIVILLNKNFIKWIIAAFVIACPIAYFAMQKWLQNFAYRTSISWWLFLVAGMIAFIVAILTVSYQSYKAASKNPVESLRYE
jgi:putative ABC transport system permease protein